MANVFRWRYFDPQPLEAPVLSSTVVEIGDFMAISTATATLNYAIPVDDIPDAGSAPAIREAAADQFIGIAMTASASGDTANVRIGTAGVWELTQQSAAAIHVGDPVEIYASTSAANKQTCVEGSTSPIGYCVAYKATAGTAILVKIHPGKINAVNS